MNTDNDRGSTTAELAVLLPAIAIVLCLLLGLGVLGAQQIRVQQAASAVARELARGQSPAHAEQSGIRLAGPAARYLLNSSSDYATVEVSREVQLPLIGTLTVRGQAQTVVEQP